MKNFLLFFVLYSPLAMAELHTYRVFKTLSGGEMQIFNIMVKSLAELDEEGAIDTTADLFLTPINGDVSQGKILNCELEIFPRSNQWPKGMEQYTCRDAVNQETSPVRYFQFSPGISKKSFLKGILINWKNQGPHSEVEYKVIRPVTLKKMRAQL